MLKRFELVYLAAERFLPALPRTVRADLRRIVDSYNPDEREVRMLDVGARKAHYTIGLPVQLVLMDVPRETELQSQLNLGATNDLLTAMRRRRSNVEDYRLEDVLLTDLPDASFDIVSAIEVIEHVPEDVQFAQRIARLLKPGGTFYCTTPNGTAVANNNPDHHRHYTREQLHEVLSSAFDEVEVVHAVRLGSHYAASQASWTLRHPVRTARSMIGGVANSRQAVTSASDAAHLVATCVRRA